MKFQPAPGIIIIDPDSTKSDSLNLGTIIEAHVKKGKVIAVGDDFTTLFGATIEVTKHAKVGDIVYYVTYEGGYDRGEVNGKEYHFVKLEDIRTRIYGNKSNQ